MKKAVRTLLLSLELKAETLLGVGTILGDKFIILTLSGYTARLTIVEEKAEPRLFMSSVPSSAFGSLLHGGCDENVSAYSD